MQQTGPGVALGDLTGSSSQLNRPGVALGSQQRLRASLLCASDRTRMQQLTVVCVALIAPGRDVRCA